jgi:hypothetical protein
MRKKSKLVRTPFQPMLLLRLIRLCFTTEKELLNDLSSAYAPSTCDAALVHVFGRPGIP